MAVHQPGQPRADGQADARAAHGMAGAVDLVEGAEKLGLVFLVDADARVHHLQGQHLGAVGPVRAVQAHDDMAGLGELDGVAEQVAENLPDAHGVARDPRRHRAVHAGKEQQAFLPGQRGE
ncbi:hypothetical protein D3C73_695710 [compost metagenome]